MRVKSWPLDFNFVDAIILTILFFLQNFSPDKMDVQISNNKLEQLLQSLDNVPPGNLP